MAETPYSYPKRTAIGSTSPQATNAESSDQLYFPEEASTWSAHSECHPYWSADDNTVVTDISTWTPHSPNHAETALYKDAFFDQGFIDPSLQQITGNRTPSTHQCIDTPRTEEFYKEPALPPNNGSGLEFNVPIFSAFNNLNMNIAPEIQSDASTHASPGILCRIAGYGIPNVPSAREGTDAWDPPYVPSYSHRDPSSLMEGASSPVITRDERRTAAQQVHAKGAVVVKGMGGRRSQRRPRAEEQQEPSPWINVTDGGPEQLGPSNLKKRRYINSPTFITHDPGAGQSRANTRQHPGNSLTPPYTCSDCPSDEEPKTYKNKSGLIRHIEMIHRDGGKKFPCSECSLAFGWKKDLEKHRDTHNDDRKYTICDECHEKFTRKDNYIRHRRKQHMGS